MKAIDKEHLEQLRHIEIMAAILVAGSFAASDERNAVEQVVDMADLLQQQGDLLSQSQLTSSLKLQAEDGDES